MSESRATLSGLPLFKVSSSATIEWIKRGHGEIQCSANGNRILRTFLLVAFNQVRKLVQESRSLEPGDVLAPGSFESRTSCLHGNIDIFLRCWLATKVSSQLPPKTLRDRPATTLQISSSVAGLIALRDVERVGTHHPAR